MRVLAVALLPLVGGPLAQALPEDADQPIDIEADKLEMDLNANVVTYIGNVRVVQGTMRVTADRMRVEYENKKVVRITATGEPAHYQQQLDAEQGEVKARAHTIVYHTQQERVQLQQNAWLEQGGNEISGELIHYDMVAGRVNAESGEEGPVTVTVQPAARTE